MSKLRYLCERQIKYSSSSDEVLRRDLDNFGSCWRSARCFMTIERSFYTQCVRRAKQVYAHLCDKKQAATLVLWRVSFHTLRALCPLPGGAKRKKYVRTKGAGVCCYANDKSLLPVCALAFGESFSSPSKRNGAFWNI